jgi:hypothetical protein
VSIIDALKRKHQKQPGRKQHTIGKKKQLNVVVSPETIQMIRRLAAEFAVPRYAITEHILETGHFYISRILKSRRKREILRKYLIDVHMLNIGRCPEEILRIGEGRYALEIISLAKNVIKDFSLLKRVWVDAKRSGNLENLENIRKKAVNSALIFAEWLSTHPLEESETEEDD